MMTGSLRCPRCALMAPDVSAPLAVWADDGMGRDGWFCPECDWVEGEPAASRPDGCPVHGDDGIFVPEMNPDTAEMEWVCVWGRHE